jgi:hypothetical protein
VEKNSMDNLPRREDPSEMDSGLERRAKEADVGLEDDLPRLPEGSVALLPLTDWLEQLDDLPQHRGVSGAKVVREIRGEWVVSRGSID